ncbi:MAG: hypothetical protein M5U26_04755 [Planctomycetota bacterium]|nr:hypothetical protein [Planctomycetota bacterium]
MHASPSMRAGFGRAEITPPLGARLRGYYHERLATGVRDPLFVRALAWEAAGRRLLLLTFDLCHLSEPLCRALREAVAAAAGLPPEAVYVAATHTHTGPEESDALSAVLAAKAAEAAAAAFERLRPCAVRIGRGRVPGLGFNRRYRLKDGSAMTNPGARAKEIVEPLGPVDDRLGVLRFEAPDGALLGVLFHFGLHVDCVGGTEISADWPAGVERELRAACGDPALHAQFLLGPCGDVNHWDFMGGRFGGKQEEASRIAAALAGALRELLGRTAPLPAAELNWIEERVELPVRRPDDRERAEARTILEQARDRTRDFTLEVVEAARVERAAALPPALAAPLRAVRLGDWRLLLAPLELFVDVAREIEAAAPGGPLWIATLAGGAYGYLPSRRAFGEGGYEVVSSLFQPEAPDLLIDRAARLLASV